MSASAAGLIYGGLLFTSSDGSIDVEGGPALGQIDLRVKVGGPFPGFGASATTVGTANSGGAAGTASRSDHIHAQDLSVVYAPAAAAMQRTGVIQQTFAAGFATPQAVSTPNGAIPFGSGGILAVSALAGHNWADGAQSLGIGISLASIGAPLHVNTQNVSPAAIFANPTAFNAAGSTMLRWTFNGVDILRMFTNLVGSADVIWAGVDVSVGGAAAGGQNTTWEKFSGASGAVGNMTQGGLGLIIGGNVGFGSVNGTLEIVAENVLGTANSDLSGNQQTAIALSGKFAQWIKKSSLQGGPLPGGTTPDFTIEQTVGGASLNFAHTAGQGVGNTINFYRNGDQTTGGTAVYTIDRIGTHHWTTLVNTTADQPQTAVWTAAAHTGQPNAEIVDFQLDGSATLTFNGSGAFSTVRECLIKPRTYAAAAVALTITTAATLAISGAPIAGANVVITNPWALLVQSGATQLQALTVNGTITTNQTVANGAVATALTSVGPAGSHTTVQEWLTFNNGSGTQRWVPCF